MNKALAMMLSAMIPSRSLRHRVRDKLLGKKRSRVWKFYDDFPADAQALALFADLSPEAKAVAFYYSLPQEARDLTLVDKIKHVEMLKDVLALLKPRKAVGVEKIRVGGNDDGGYVMLEPGTSGLALSLGVSTYAPWDLEMAERGFIVHQYDGTIANNPDQHPSIFFHRQNVDASKNPLSGTASIDEILRVSEAEKYDNVILEMDIEGAEWDLFENIRPEQMELFDQIIVELHDLYPGGKDFDRYVGIVRKIGHTHTPVHVHCNNVAFLKGTRQGFWGFPHLYEVTYARNSAYSFVDSDETYPTPLDRKNVVGIPEIPLGDLNRL